MTLLAANSSSFKTLRAIILIAACALFHWAYGQNTVSNAATAVVTTDHVRAELIAHAPQGVQPGQPLLLGLQITHQPDWHTYWKNAGDSGLPTMLHWTLPEGVTAQDTQWPLPQKILIGNLANYGYEGTVLLTVPLQVNAKVKPALLSGDVQVKLKAEWLVCKKECIPEEGEFALNLPRSGSTALHAAAFDTAQAAVPRNVPNLQESGGSSARVADNRLQLSIHNLPVALRGKTLALFPETAEVLHNAAVAGTDWTQRWTGAVWTADFPLSAQRSASPSVMSLVLAASGDAQAYRVDAKVLGEWPAVAAGATVSPALDAALKANASAQSVPLLGDGGAANDALTVLPAVLLALLGGLILNLMPCVFPVLAIKVLGFAQHAHDARARVASGVGYTVGVVLSFMALGGLMLALRAGGEALGWGFQLQSPAVVAALALLFTLIGLNLLGVFEWGSMLPSSIATLQSRHASVDAFLSGVLAVAVASPCTAPFMGASLGFALGLPAWQALAVFAAIGVGMALPYLAASLVPALAALLPRPGAWMQVFRTLMAFPMFGTVAWLTWVLGQQSGIDGAASLLVLLIAVSMLVWALSLKGRARTTTAIISIAACALFTWAIGQNIIKNAEPQTAQSANATWQNWEPGKVEQLLVQGQPVFVDFTAAWCVTCQLNKKTTLSQTDVLADFSAKKVHLLRADWTRRDPGITAALQQLGRSGVPVYVLYKPGSAPVVLSEILSVAQMRAALSTL